MKFSVNQFLKFGTREGSYSKVTGREHYDSQITATDAEAEILVNYFGLENLHVGNVKSNPRKASKEFTLYPSGEKIHLNLLFPKTNKQELRLYLSVSSGFKPEPNSIWFLFVLKGVIWIGAMPEREWRSENVGVVDDETDLIYQTIIQESDTIKVTTLSARESFQRNRVLAIERMNRADYKCENNPSHSLFISKYSNQPYLEAHHLVPLSLQRELNTNLDVLANIYCLCPYCHRAIHYAEAQVSIPLIDNLLGRNDNMLDVIGVSNYDVYKFYSLEEII